MGEEEKIIKEEETVTESVLSTDETPLETPSDGTDQIPENFEIEAGHTYESKSEEEPNDETETRFDHVVVYEHDFLGAVAYWLYSQAPGHKPRQAEIIMDKVRENFRENAIVVWGSMYSHIVPRTMLYQFIDQMLKSIPEFCQLNLTQNEWDAGLRDPEDEARKNFPARTIVSAYDNEDLDTWRYDFIDLGAFVGNVKNLMRTLKDAYDNCFGCMHDRKDKNECETCKKCVVNPNYINNFVEEKKLKGKYTISCKYDCPHLRYICCTECDKRADCKERCDRVLDNTTPDDVKKHCTLALHGDMIKREVDYD